MATVRHIRPNRERPPESLIEAEGCKVHITEGRIDVESGRRFTTVEVIVGGDWEHDCRKVNGTLIIRITEADTGSGHPP